MITSAFHPTKVLALTLLLLNALMCDLSAAAGDVDLSFDPGSGVNGTVRTVAVQPDGKVLVGGEFTTVKGLARANLARLNADGSGDSTFDPGNRAGGSSTPVQFIALQADGKMLVLHPPFITRLNSDGSHDSSFSFYAVGGDYTEVFSFAVQPDGRLLVSGNTVTQTFDPEGYVYYSYTYFVTRVYADGSRDPSFNKLGAGADGVPIYGSLALQPDGKVLVGSNGIRRLNGDGTPDGSFHPGANGSVGPIVVQPDGKLLLGGWSLGNGANRNPLVRLNADGSLDSSFNLSTEADAAVNSLVLQSDGKVLIGGSFTTVHGTNRNGIARLNANGSLDSSFNPGTGTNVSYSEAIKSIALQSDEKVLIGGGFSHVNGVRRNRIARLNPDGSLDQSFHSGSEVTPSVFALAVQPNGKTLIGGDFTAVQDLNRTGIARLNPDGSVDGSFNVTLHSGDPEYDSSAFVTSIVVQSDGKALIAGVFAVTNGTRTEYGIARLHADGSVDSTFNPSVSGSGEPIALQPDGKVLLGGVRLNGDGSMDGTFDATRESQISSIALQPDGKVIVGELFNGADGSHRNGVTRWNANGSLDSSFHLGAGVFGYVASVAVQSNGKVLVGGAFTSVNATDRTAIARHNPDGTLDGAFNPQIESNSTDYPVVKSMVAQPDGKVLIGGLFSTVNGVGRKGIARLNANGSLDDSFDPGPGIGGGDYPVVNSIAVQSDRKVVVGGAFTTMNGVVRPYVARLAGDSESPPNNPPSVSISSPAEGATYPGRATVDIDVDAFDSDGTVTRVDLYAGNIFLGSDSSAPFEFSWDQVPAGNHALTADATDNLGATSTSTAVNIVVTNTSPLVAITKPVNGSTFPAAASVTITVDASDADGTIARVEVYAGESLIDFDDSAPFEVTWNVTAPGSYALSAVATDNLGASSRSVPVDLTIVAPSTPAAPSRLTVTTISVSRIDLSWIDNAANESGFKIERSTNGKPFKPIATVGANVTTFSNSGLLKGEQVFLSRARL